MTFLEECIAFTGPVWERYQHHPWIDALFEGTLSNERFEYWLIQDLPYLGDYNAAVVFPKVPPHNPWIKLQMEYLTRSDASRVELKMLEKYGDFAKTHWAARPQREAFINFWARIVYEGSFGEICCAFYPCYAFGHTFGLRLKAEQTTGLPPLQQEWVEQWIDPYYEELRAATEDGLNESGAHASDYEREQMMWTFLRSTQHQIGTFDAAWNLSDPWPGEGDETGVLAGAPSLEKA